MSKQITHVSVFLASPSDVLEERSAVKQVIDELNLIIRQTLGVHLDLIGWETHAYPSVGLDAQDVINRQVGDDHDIFIGIMWQRFGTPTGRAGSGTEEEFQRAYNRFKKNHLQPKIMLYFSSMPVQPDIIDLEQLAKVRNFKIKAQELGVLHWSYSDVESFQKMLKIHLTNHVLEIKHDIKENGSDDIIINPRDVDKNVVKDDDINEREGYFDLMEVFSETMPEVERILIRLSSHMEELGGRMNEKTARIDALNKSPKRSPQSYRILLDRVADDIMNYVDMTRLDLPKYHNLFSKGIDALSNAFALADESNQSVNREEFIALSEAIADVKEVIKSTVSSMIYFRESGSSFPPMAKSVTKAARLLRETATSVIDELNTSETLFDELQIMIDAALVREDGESGAEKI